MTWSQVVILLTAAGGGWSAGADLEGGHQPVTYVRPFPKAIIKQFPCADREALTSRTFGFCGADALWIAARMRKESVDLQRVASDLASKAGTCSVADIVRCAHNLGFLGARAVRLQPHEFGQAPFPMIGYLHGAQGRGHFVVFSRRERGWVQVVDFPREVAWVSLEQLMHFNQTWRGEVVLLGAWRGSWGGSLAAAAIGAAPFGMAAVVMVALRRIGGQGPAQEKLSL